ncbi:MAG: phosphotransferase [Candidatus Obscuribacterales bacterium]|nr:phosphotransferase [Candidatus Obscuribacterales bacterium]
MLNADSRLEKNLEVDKEAKLIAARFGFLLQEVKPYRAQTYRAKALNKQEKQVELLLKWQELPEQAELLKLSQLAQDRVLNCLSNCGYKQVPNRFLAETKEPFFQLGNRLWTCQSYVFSETTYDWLHFNVSSPHCFLAGQALSQIHNAGSRLTRETPDLIDIRLAADNLRTFHDELKSSISRLLSRQNNLYSLFQNHEEKPSLEVERNKSLDILMQIKFDNVIEKSRSLCAKLIHMEKNSQTTINHGDYHPGNLLFSKNSVDAVIDWEFLNVGSGINDLTYALFMFCLNPPKRGQASSQLFDSRKTEAFLEGYTRASSTVKNIERLSSYTEYVHLLMLAWVCNELCSESSKYKSHEAFPGLVRSLAYCCAA